MERIFIVLAGVNGLLAVALGAFGAHGLKARLGALADGAPRLAWWETASHYHLMHALALGLCAQLVVRGPAGGAAKVAGSCFLAGIVLFSGSLYAMTLSGMRVLGAITPLGGLCFLAGWAAVIIAGLALR
jgi:uncharacterized membrane protein YgdD (TMEM256/DUF423 family)